jgi:hypothetical protein
MGGVYHSQSGGAIVMDVSEEVPTKEIGKKDFHEGKPDSHSSTPLGCRQIVAYAGIGRQGLGQCWQLIRML